MSKQLEDAFNPKLVVNAAKLYLPVLEKYHRAKFLGFEHIPQTPFLGVGNHSGMHFMPESLLWLTKYHSMNNKVHMVTLIHNLSHKLGSLLKLPLKDFGLVEANPEKALNALQSGFAATVYPGSDRDNSKPFSERNKIDFFEHTGYVKLALKAQVPIVPIVGIGGAETVFVLSAGDKIAEVTGLKKMLKLHTWPVYWSFPGGWHVGHLPYFSLPLPAQITISVLPPYFVDEYTPDDAENPDIVQKINLEIIIRMQEEMNRLAKGRIPIVG
jgi:1-acyl-sn-glycerol-3-phosphate acyltransferase